MIERWNAMQSRTSAGASSSSNVEPYPTFNPGNGAYYLPNLSDNTWSQMVISMYCLSELSTSVENHQKPDVQILQIYPNPTFGLIRLNNVYPNSLIEIFSAEGELLHVQRITELNPQISISKLPQGLYVVRVISDDGIKQGKFVKY